MKKYIKTIISVFAVLLLISCNGNEEKNNPEETQEEEEHAEVEEAMLTQQQFEALGMEIDTLQKRNMIGFVEANGELEVPPQNEANVTTVIGANVAAINVIEGDQIQKGEVLAYITHPDIVKIQTEYLNAVNQLEFLEKEYNRQNRLYEAGVGSGETFQKSEADFKIAQGLVNGLEAQLKLLNLNPARIVNGTIYNRIPVTSPISGAVQKVNVKTGQYVQAQTNMFEIVNTEHVHADLMVFENDVSKVKVGQEVNFTVESLAGKELKAQIISISKTFEQDPKALHVHAEIKNKPKNLIPGMYVRGKIQVNNTKATAFPGSAIAKDADKFFVFTAEREGKDWSFKPVEVIVKNIAGDWIAVDFMSEIDENTFFAFNNAYYLMAEMKKGEGGHEH
ncbi:MAG TPA: efflux RND transporter periplasmic adaptor subunit [Salinimicrobium sp.]|nr:efflux RND transporter periplasmic adaptor subunit [Salinimicrobium sp.]